MMRTASGPRGCPVALAPLPLRPSAPGPWWPRTPGKGLVPSGVGARILAAAAAVAALVAGVVVALPGRSSAAGGPTATLATSEASQPGLLPNVLDLPPLQLGSLPPVQLPPITLPNLPPLIGAASTPIPAAYHGLAGWVSLYNYGGAGDAAPAQVVGAMASRGIDTLYIQTARWNSPTDIEQPGQLGAYIDAAHAAGIDVVGWYLPGFGDVATDIRRSLAVLDYTSPGGGHVDGFAADIEDHGATATLAQFNAGIVAYANALRAAVPSGTILGAIVPDVKNNERAPAHWAGFPWPEIGADFDVVLPMAYWSVTKNLATCLATQYDVASYMSQVISTTESLMGRSLPIAPMGGVANCDTEQEVAAYVSTLRHDGAIGGGLYDFASLQARADANSVWSELAPLRG